jgi:pilus assembly protein Flp/PilA
MMYKQQKEGGQGLVEYALILVLVAIAVVLIVQLLGSSLMVVYARVVGGLNGQSITGIGTEHLVTSYEMTVTGAGPGACNVTVANASVIVLQDGEILTNGPTGSVAVTGSGGSSSMSGTTNGSGIATGLGTAVSGVGCPGVLTIGNTGHQARIRP